MKIQTAIAIVLSAASVSAQAGNWAVKNGWCQTMTDNGQALVMLKNDTIGIQENLIKGGLSARTAQGKRSHTRAVKGIDGDLKLNRALWVMAEQMQQALG